MSTSGLVFDIKKFAIHDGPGIRTTVFLKGCPLHCLWCHNPESQEKAAEIFFTPHKCIGCGYCVKVCPTHSHRFTEKEHLFNRDTCRRCGLCTEQCYAQALETAGKEMSVDEVLAEVLKDKPFYDTSLGGMTISGGEPMAQFAFTRDLLQAAKQAGLHNCLDTCGFTAYEHYRQIKDDVDLFLYDIKETDSAKHREFTGVDNRLILENLHQLDSAGAASIIRCPIVPGYNDREDHFANIGKLAQSLQHVQEITIHPYHPLGKSKNERLGKSFTLATLSFPDDTLVNQWIAAIERHTAIPVKRA